MERSITKETAQVRKLRKRRKGEEKEAKKKKKKKKGARKRRERIKTRPRRRLRPRETGLLAGEPRKGRSEITGGGSLGFERLQCHDFALTKAGARKVEYAVDEGEEGQ